MGPDGGGPMAAIPTMFAEDSFFDGKIEAEARFGRGPMPMRPGSKDGRGGNGRPERGHGMPPPGMGGGFGGPGRGDGPGHGGMPEFGDAGEMRPNMREANNPTVQLRLRLTNHSDATLEVEVLTFQSLLGNFVVQPSKFSIEPGLSVEPEPMASRLGIPEGGLELKIKLRSGGKTEEKILILETQKGAPPPPPPAS